VVASAVLHGCLFCTEEGCAGGFAWEARPRDGMGLQPGLYEVEIVLDDDSFTTTCTIADTYGDSECTFIDEGEWFVSFDLQQLDRNEWMPEDPPGGFDLRASQMVEDGRKSSTRGPARVEIEITRDGANVITTAYDVEYVRDEDFWGDERCGFCDLEQRRASTL
jgi:hypothetical protein